MEWRTWKERGIERERNGEGDMEKKRDRERLEWRGDREARRDEGFINRMDSDLGVIFIPHAKFTEGILEGDRESEKGTEEGRE